MEDLQGRTAFITGGASGIGLGIARACAAAGMRLALVDVDGGALERAADELGSATDVHAAVLDVRDREAYARAADAAEAAVGPVSLLCNNAGIAGQVSVDDASYDTWDWVIGVNLNGCYNGIQTFLPRMLERGEPAHIVNTASEAGLSAFGGIGYLDATSKFGVVGMSEALHGELRRRGIGVSVLCPHAVATNILDNTVRASGDLDPELAEELGQQVDRIRHLVAAGADPDEVGRLVLEGVRAGRLYLLTSDHLAESIRRRADLIIQAMPSAAVDK
jgi:NAD(P)-dependent dehydrogenase (short-subunit alcohol dehydrogenase family)